MELNDCVKCANKNGFINCYSFCPDQSGTVISASCGCLENSEEPCNEELMKSWVRDKILCAVTEGGC